MPKKQDEKQPDLFFEQSSSISGFNVLAEQSTLNPTIITRELIQNALDAVREAGKATAIIRFEVIKHKPRDIPAFATYKKAFRAAEKGARRRSGGELPDTEQDVVNRISAQVEAKTIETLCVSDNGIGLNEGRMAALLGEGISAKSGAGAGSYGYGHTTVIPASDLRYMLYAGLCEGQKIAAGHAVLASFEQDEELKGKDGYFVIDRTNKIDAPFKFPRDNAIPDMIADKLKTIAKKWGSSGSVIMIPGFNRFREDGGLWGVIREAAACNFFAAIAEGQLQVEYQEGDSSKVLDKKTLEAALEEYRQEKKTRRGFLSGYRAHQAYETISNGESHKVKTGLGTIEFRLRELSEGITQIDLCRNGMHISGSIPMFGRGEFTNYKPFHCLIMTSSDDGEFHQLVRKSEPPKHDAIDPKGLPEAEKNKIRNALRQIRDELKSKLTKLAAEDFKINDVLNLDKVGIDELEELAPRVRGSRGGKPVGRKKNGRKRKREQSGDGGFRKSGTAVSFSATPVQTGKRSYAVSLSVQENPYDNELRFALDEGLDLTSDAVGAEDFVALSNIKIDGKKVAKDRLIKNEQGKVLGVNLGKSDTSKEMHLTFDYALPDETDIEKNAPVSLQAEMVSRKTEQEG